MASIEECKHVHDFNGTLAQCDFVQNNEHCNDTDGYFNYVEILYCDFGGTLAPLAIFIYALWLIVLFIGLGESADSYFCPNLAIISKTLRLSQNIAGVTILAFGNGAPDIFSALASVQQARPELLLGGLFGAGIFVTTAVAGSVCLSTPFKLMERPFLRDVAFYIAAGFWAYCIFHKGEITLGDSLGFLGLYVVYIIVVVVGRIINQKLRRNVETGDQNDLIDNNSVQTFEDPEENPDGPPYISWIRPESISGSGASDQIDANSVESRTVQPKVWNDFLDKMNPLKEWSQSSKFKKLWLVVKSPVVLVLTMTIPVVNLEEENQGWSQYLHAFQIALSGLTVTFFGQFWGIQVLSFELWQFMLVLSLLSSLLFLIMSEPEKPPKWQPILAFAGFVISVGWIYLIANEIVSLLKAVGIQFGISDAILGLTVLAWGNSIGDMVADIAIAKQGYPRMGFSACFGGPLFNLLLGIGIPFTIQLVKNGGNPITFDNSTNSKMVQVLSASLGVALIVNFVLFPVTKFKANKVHGFILVVLYIILLTTSIVIEFSQ